MPMNKIDVVSNALSQNTGFKKPIKKVAIATNVVVPRFLPLAKNVITTTPAITTGHGTITKNRFNP